MGLFRSMLSHQIFIFPSALLNIRVSDIKKKVTKTKVLKSLLNLHIMRRLFSYEVSFLYRR